LKKVFLAQNTLWNHNIFDICSTNVQRLIENAIAVLIEELNKNDYQEKL
jgi:hypothetical protein